MLTIIASTSLLGTIIPQNSSPDSYLYLYGDFFYQVFSFIGLFNMYHSLWFQLMLFTLGINIIVCTFARFPNVWKFVFNKRKNIKFRKFSQNIEFKSFRSIDELCSLFSSGINNRFNKLTLSKTDKKTTIHAESGRWTKFGPHVIHLSILLLLIGSLVSSIFGFEGYVNVIEGNTINSIRLKGNNKLKILDFDIRCDSFGVELYENGTPKKYISKLTLMKENTPILQKEVIVNNPIHHNGINIFQSSYGKIPSKLTDLEPILNEHIEIIFKIKKSGITYKKKFKIGVSIELPENLGYFSVLEYLPSANFNGINLGRAFKCKHYYSENIPPEIIILPLDFPKFDLMREGEMQISLSDEIYDAIKHNGYKQKYTYYTGLQITKDPGKWIVYTGFYLIIYGFIVTLFMSHKEVYIKITSKEEYNEVTISGYTNNNKLVTKVMINEIYRIIS